MKLGYARVSTTGQNLEAQIAALWAAGVEKIYQDKASGKDRNHPALKEMLDFARQGDEQFELVDPKGRTTLDITSAADGTPRLALLGKDGKARISLMLA